MKLKLLFGFIAIVIATFTANSQVTITNKDMPSAGDTIRYSSVLPIGVSLNLKNTGANVTWDYSGLVATGNDLYEYKSALTTPYIFSFFGAMGLKIADTLGFGQMSATKVYAFYRNSTSKFVQRGYGFSIVLPGTSFPLPLKGEYTDEDEIYEFPLTYEDSYTNSFNLKIPIGTAPIVLGNFYRVGSRSTVVDGWGKITTPYKKDMDCIRLKSRYTSKDSIVITTPALNFGLPTVTIEYKWLTPGEKIPVLEVIGTEALGIFTPTSVRYRGVAAPQNNSIEDLKKGLTTVSQNGKDGIVVIKNNNVSIKDAFLTDAQGRKMTDLVFTNGECTIEFNKYGKGAYFVRAANGYLKLVY